MEEQRAPRGGVSEPAGELGAEEQRARRGESSLRGA